MPRKKKDETVIEETANKKNTKTKAKENKEPKEKTDEAEEGEVLYRDIKLSDDYILRRDNACMWIEEKGIGKKGKAAGKETWNRVTGYYNNMQFTYLFQSFANKKFRSISNETSSPMKYLSKMKDLEQEIHSMIETMLKEIEHK